MIVASTVSRSSEELTARNTSSSACSSATERVSSSVRVCNSASSRAFSIAMTAWSAKVRTSFDLSLGERLDPLPTEIDRADHDPFTKERYAEHGPNLRKRPGLGHRVFRIGSDVGDVDDTTREDRPPG